MEEREAIRRAKLGDTRAFGFLVETRHRPLLAFIHRIVRDPVLAEDLGQDVFLSAYRALDRFDENRGVPFSAWLFAIARNRAVSVLRQRAREHWAAAGVVSEDMADPRPDALSEMLDRERVVVVADCLEHVPEPYRSTLLDRLDGMTVREIAERRGVAWNTVKTRLHRARQKLMQLAEGRLEEQP